jgi:hypothetical protein
MSSATDTPPPGMDETCRRFWLWRLLRRKRPLRTHQPPAGQGSLRIGKPDSPKCQTGPSAFPGSNSSSWSLARVGIIEGGTLYRPTRGQSREKTVEERVFSRWQSKARCREKSRGGGSRAEQGSEVKAGTKTGAGTSSWQPPNWTVWFSKLDHPVSSASG